jgi:hypothetical protein
MSGQVHYWPLAVGWIVVAVLLLTGFRRQALIAGAGMAVVSYYVIGVGTDWAWMPR